MLQTKNGDKIKAEFYRPDGTWRVDLHETICGQTKVEAERKASHKLNEYRESEKKIGELQSQFVLAI